MEESTEYQIFIGCNDSQSHKEVVGPEELREIVMKFFEKTQTDFSIVNAMGGYLYEKGCFVTENSLCINIIGQDDETIGKLVKSLSMYMNQEYILVTKNPVRKEFRHYV